MPIKKSVRLVDDTIILLNQLTETGEVNWSGSINALAERYAMFVDDNLPELSEREWYAFYCAYNGRMSHHDIKAEVKMMHFGISESWEHDELVHESLTEAEMFELVAKIKSWSLSQKLAVYHKVRAYWRNAPIVDSE